MASKIKKAIFLSFLVLPFANGYYGDEYNERQYREANSTTTNATIKLGEIIFEEISEIISGLGSRSTSDTNDSSKDNRFLYQIEKATPGYCHLKLTITTQNTDEKFDKIADYYIQMDTIEVLTDTNQLSINCEEMSSCLETNTYSVRGGYRVETLSTAQFFKLSYLTDEEVISIGEKLDGLSTLCKQDTTRTQNAVADTSFIQPPSLLKTHQLQ